MSTSPIAVRPSGLVGGALAGLGIVVLLQQYGVRPLTAGLLVAGIAVGLLVGVALPSIARAVARRRVDAAPATTPATASPPADWTATHVVPTEGMWAWETPDPTSQPSTPVQGSLDVEVVEQTGNWARVVAANGWEGWVDASQLQPRT